MRGWSGKRWLAAAAVVAVVLVGGAYAIFALVAGRDSPPPVALSYASPSEGGSEGGTAADDGTPATEADGMWTLDTASSFVGYRVREELAFLPAPSDAVGRTSAVTGTLQIDGLRITAVDVTADLTQLTSDESRRDDRIRTNGLETSTFPEAAFTLTSPIAFDAEPTDGETVEVTATGDTRFTA